VINNHPAKSSFALRFGLTMGTRRLSRSLAELVLLFSDLRTQKIKTNFLGLHVA
jgi:hypothetical protein